MLVQPVEVVELGRVQLGGVVAVGLPDRLAEVLGQVADGLADLGV